MSADFPNKLGLFYHSVGRQLYHKKQGQRQRCRERERGGGIDRGWKVGSFTRWQLDDTCNKRIILD